MPFDFNSLWSPIWNKNPALKALMERYGNRSVYEYAQSFLEPHASIEERRQEEWLTVFNELLEIRLGKSTADEVTSQLRRFPLVSTADHHAPLDEAYWVNTNLLHGLAQQEAGNRYCVALSFASISLNTALGYPRGLLLHDLNIKREEGPGYRFYPEEKLLRLSYFADKEKMSVVYGFKPFRQEDFEHLMNALKLKTKEGSLSTEDAERLKNWSEKYLLNPEFLRQKDYSSQITVLNHQFWPALFSDEAEVPRVVYLEIETLVSELLQRVHFKQPDSPIYKLMFSPEGRAAFVEAFEGIHGAFCAHENDGTYYFWGLDDKGHRVRLFLKEDCLHSETKEICISLTPEAFGDALQSGKIFPSMALCYVLMSFYYRLRSLGGSSQIRDLGHTQAAWIKVLKAMGLDEEAASVAELPTHDLVGSIGLSALQIASGDTVLPTGMDLALLPEKKAFSDYKKRAQNLSVNDAISLYAKDLYIDYCRDLPFPLKDLPV